MSEEEKLEALKEYMQSSMEYVKDRKKKYIKKGIIITICIIIFLIFSNTIIIQTMLRLTNVQYTRYYNVTLNDITFNSINENIEPTTIIPNILVIGNSKQMSFYEHKETKIALENKPYTLNIKSYSCYIPDGKSKVLTDCNSFNWDKDAKSENFDTLYYQLSIKKYTYDKSREFYDGKIYHYSVSEPSTIIYEGNYTDDITPYISEQGAYIITINFQYKHTKGRISANLVNNGENILFP